jgi:hypothetical protein
MGAGGVRKIGQAYDGPRSAGNRSGVSNWTLGDGRSKNGRVEQLNAVLALPVGTPFAYSLRSILESCMRTPFVI